MKDQEKQKNLDLKTTAILITDPQNDFLSEGGAVWDFVGWVDVVFRRNDNRRRGECRFFSRRAVRLYLAVRRGRSGGLV